MAQLLGIRLLQDSPILSSCDSYYFPKEKPKSDEKAGCFLNPAFQTVDELPERSLPESETSVTSPETVSKRSLSPSDSGIDITEDLGSLKSSAESKPPSKPPSDATIEISIVEPPGGKKLKDEKQESLLSIVLQVFFPFLIAGIGTCGAGLLLDYVEEWEVFVGVKELFILVPTLLGLKGNLEMTLASRVSTQANLGQLESSGEQWRMSWGNLALVQCQATILALVSSCIATAISSFSASGFQIEKALLLCASALFTASVASFVLGAITLVVVLLSKKIRINPDNVATPIAASLGDLSTLGILAAIAGYLYRIRGDLLSPSICVAVFVALVPVWLFLSYRNVYVKGVLLSGWAPVVLAVIITSAGGYILEYSVDQFKGFAIYQPVINGVAGNLVAVQASRISTYFHAHGEPGSRPPDGSSLCVSPFGSFFGKNPHARTARVLLLMVVPGHLLFGYGIKLVKQGATVLTLSFLPIYLAAALIQVAILLYIAQCLIHILWRWKMDPDNWAIPLLTALGDLSGIIALTTAFWIHRSLGSP